MKGSAVKKPLVGIVMGSQSDWDVMQHAVNINQQFAELGGPARHLPCGSHENFMVMDRLSKSGLEAAAKIKNAKLPVAKAAWPLGADMRERRH
jgi:phosphoribosylcarboxyaminoimidazole (NCAIR) mutase